MVDAAADPGQRGQRHHRHALIQTALAAVISVPLGILVAICLVDTATDARRWRGPTFMVDILSGVPSIVAAHCSLYAAWRTTLGFERSDSSWPSRWCC